MQDQKSFTFRWRSIPGWGQELVSPYFDYNGGQYIQKQQWCTIMNILRLTAAYLNATITRPTWNAEPEMGPDRSSHTPWKRWVDGYRSRFGPPRGSRSGVRTGLELNRTVFPVRFRTAGSLPGPIANTTAGWRWTFLIWRTFNWSVGAPGSSFADKADGEGDPSDDLNPAGPWCWKSNQDALTISFVSEMYFMAVICLFWAHDSICVAHRLWQTCHIAKMLWTWASMCNLHCFALFSNSMSSAVSVICNRGKSPPNIALLARANCLTTTFSRSILPVVLDCLQPVTTRSREKLAFIPTPRDMTENKSSVRLERLVYSGCVSSCWPHQSVISGNQNVLLISIGPEWYTLRFGSSCPQFFGTSGGEFN